MFNKDLIAHIIISKHTFLYSLYLLNSQILQKIVSFMDQITHKKSNLYFPYILNNLCFSSRRSNFKSLYKYILSYLYHCEFTLIHSIPFLNIVFTDKSIYNRFQNRINRYDIP